jgi:drug/metabolite transporter (DMT)-like permease
MNSKQTYLLPISALIGNALIWGLIWWPLRELRLHGWHPLWSTMAVFFLVSAGFALVKPGAFSSLRKPGILWLVGIAAGVTNGAFNWGIATGDVVRVILLFYLMPVWAVLLARIFLKEAVTPLALLRIALALTGAFLVMQPADGGLPLPSSLADWLGLIGGIAFAATNVVLRRAAGQPRDGRALVMFLGGFVIPSILAISLASASAIGFPTAFDTYAIFLLVGSGIMMLVANLALQYGAVRLPVNITAVVMLTEVVFATVSSLLIDATVLTGGMLAGGALILLASALAALEKSRPATAPAAKIVEQRRTSKATSLN